MKIVCSYEGGQYYIKSEEEMKQLFPYALQALENTQKIADRCNVEIEFGVTKLPKYDVPEGYTSWEYLNKLCFDGLKERYPDGDDSLKERLEYELSVIKSMGYVDYFLIVWDFINYARTQGIKVGPGEVRRPEVSYRTVWELQVSIRSNISFCSNVS